jgi:hypothetical protein
MADPKPERTVIAQVIRSVRTAALGALFVLSAGFVGGTLIAVVGKPIWLWVNWLWNLY